MEAIFEWLDVLLVAAAGVAILAAGWVVYRRR